MAAQSAEIYRRLVTLSRFVPEANRDLVVDLVDQYDRLHNLAEQERDYLDGVIEFYRTRTDTRMLIAGERLAVIAVVTLPVTALASVFGMNFIEGARWSPVPMIAVITTMAVMSTCLLIWAKRKGWW
jgi:Mg2+ and Co2+ transporter CorA